MGVYDFPMLEIGDFFGINTDLRINPNSIPHTDVKRHFQEVSKSDFTACRSNLDTFWKCVICDNSELRRHAPFKSE